MRALLEQGLVAQRRFGALFPPPKEGRTLFSAQDGPFRHRLERMKDPFTPGLAAGDWTRLLEPIQALGCAGAKVWFVNLQQPGEFVRKLQTLLGSEELERAGRFLTDPARNRFIVSHAALRTLLSQEIGVAPSALRFRHSPKGKPSLASQVRDGALEFSLAHSADAAVVAVARGRLVGVDIEEVHDRPDLAAIAERFFAPAEQIALAKQAETEPLGKFYRIWTRKEAVLKACGEGITGGLRAPDVSPCLHETPPDGLPVQFHGVTWSVHDLVLSGGYMGAIAVAA